MSNPVMSNLIMSNSIRSDLQLVAPSAEYKNSVLDAIREAQTQQSGFDDTLMWNLDELERDFEVLLHHARRHELGNVLEAGYVHSEQRWLVQDQTYLGRVSIRYTLTQRLREFGGHIGYEVRPSERGKGYATLILKLALERAHELDINPVLISCADDNSASRRVIEKNGGVLEGVFNMPEYHSKPIRRYWVHLL